MSLAYLDIDQARVYERLRAQAFFERYGAEDVCAESVCTGTGPRRLTSTIEAMQPGATATITPGL